jgi:hypothetical protein
MAGSIDKNAVAHLTATTPTAITSDVHGTIQITEPERGVPDQLFGLLSTIVWATLIAVMVFAFRKYVCTFLANLNARVAGGAPIDTPWIKLGTITQQSPAQQAAGTVNAVRQMTPEGQELQPRVVEDIEKEKTRYVAVEDLALRQVQGEFAAPMSRKIQADGEAFDAMFVVGQVAYLVTVADLSSAKTDKFALTIVTMVARPITKIGWKDARGLLVLVYDCADVDLLEQTELFLKQAKLMIVPIEIRAYKLSDLEAKFGVKIPS